MTLWPLAVLRRVRSAQARAAAREAAALRAGASRARCIAEELALRAAEQRRGAAFRRSLSPAGLAGELALGASSRSATDLAARRTARDGQRAGAEAERARHRAVEAATVAHAMQGRAEALTRGLERWEERRRRCQEACREREVEEAWSGSRGGLPQVERCTALPALDLEPPGPEVARRRFPPAVELGRGEHHLLARTQRSLLVLPGPVEGEHDVGPDLVRLVAHEDLLAAQEGVLEDVDVGADRVAGAGGGAGDPEGQEGGDQPATHQAEPSPLPAPRPAESFGQVRGSATPVVERPLDEARDALRSISHGGSLPYRHGTCAGGIAGI